MDTKLFSLKLREILLKKMEAEVLHILKIGPASNITYT